MKAEFTNIVRPDSPLALDAVRKIPGVRIGPRAVRVPLNAIRAVYAQLQPLGEQFKPKEGLSELDRRLPDLNAPPLAASEIKNLKPGIAEHGWDGQGLRPFQRAAIARSLQQRALEIVHPCGTGKTATAIACCQQQGAEGYVVVVTRAAHRKWWRAEIDYMTDAGARIYLGAAGASAGIAAEGTPGARYQIVSFEMVESFEEDWRARGMGIAWLVIDEAHKIKDSRGVRRKAIRQLVRRADRQLQLTATPNPDRTRDFYGQFDVLEPGAWGMFALSQKRRQADDGPKPPTFSERYLDAHEDEYGHYDTRGSSNLHELKWRWAHIVHFVSEEETRASLPPVARQIHFVSREEMLKGRKGTGMPALEGLRESRTAQSWFEAKLAEAASRLRPYTVELTADVALAGGRVLILTGRHADVVAIGAALEKRLNPKEREEKRVWIRAIHGGAKDEGGLSPEEQEDVRGEYMAQKGAAVLVGTADILGESANLHSTDALIHAMLPWNYGQYRQRRGRVQRLGGRRCTEHFLIGEGTVGEHVAEVFLSKLPAYETVTGDADAGALERDLSGMSDEAGILDALVKATVAQSQVGSKTEVPDGAGKSQEVDPPLVA